ncbi:HNH endonuclease [Pseudooceanicola atlanticus]|uniref:HNH endonuclease n=1 Tax=Pseudooceanicola atlanticus TaxID=1461694 RepID=UPI0009DD89A7|nr:HNH endonuclease signature motif containing protein [Pseudooceanicola atlanticus]
MKRSMSTTRRARIFAAANGICHICGQPIDGTKEAWDADHVIPLEISRDDSDDNLRPAHKRCHSRKTAESDMPAIAKAKRVKAKHEGAFKTRNPLPGSRGSALKKRIDGTVVRRGPG